MKENLIKSDTKTKNKSKSSGGLTSDTIMNSQLMQQKIKEQKNLFGNNTIQKTDKKNKSTNLNKSMQLMKVEFSDVDNFTMDIPESYFDEPINEAKIKDIIRNKIILGVSVNPTEESVHNFYEYIVASHKDSEFIQTNYMKFFRWQGRWGNVKDAYNKNHGIEIKKSIEPQKDEKVVEDIIKPLVEVNIKEKFQELEMDDKESFNNWFHSFANTLTLLSSRQDIQDGKLDDKIKKLLKFELTKHQIQATYNKEDSKRVNRETSPLVNEGYARGIKTGLWDVSQRIIKDKSFEQLKESTKQASKKDVSKFEIFPASKAFSYKGKKPTIADKFSKTDSNKEMIYVTSLKAQFINLSTIDEEKKTKLQQDVNIIKEKLALNINDKKLDNKKELQQEIEKIQESDSVDIKKLKEENERKLKKELKQIETKSNSEIDKLTSIMEQEVKKDINSFMGGEGLRTSASESSDIVIEEMIKHIKNKDIKKALEISTSISYNKDDDRKLLIEKLKEVNLDVNSMIVPFEGDKKEPSTLDTLLQSSEYDLNQLEALNKKLKYQMTNIDNLPFYIGQNLSVLYNLAGKNLITFFDRDTPSKIMADFIDTLGFALDIAKNIEKLQELEYPYAIERFYQQMQKAHHIIRFQLDWKGDTTSLDKALKSMLPTLPEEIKDEDIKTYSAPHGLAMISQIDKSLDIKEPEKIGILHGSYYETPDIFAKGKGEKDERIIDNINNPKLKDRELIVMEPHPNNAAASDIIPHNPVELIKELFKESSSKHTIVMDVTLNHLGEKEIKDVLNEAQTHINSGKLNLILLQSGTKFFQNGMDLVNIGTAVIFNKGDNWQTFNKNMEDSKQDVPKDDSLYIANMLSKNKDELKEYLDRVRANTQKLRKKLLFGNDNAFELLSNSDTNTVYVAFQLTEKAVKLWLGLEDDAKVDVDTRAKANQAIYKEYVLKPMNRLPSVDRSSFGFNVTNLGECYNTVRITLGIENEKLLVKYANNIIDSGKALLTKVKGK